MYKKAGVFKHVGWFNETDKPPKYPKSKSKVHHWHNLSDGHYYIYNHNTSLWEYNYK